MKRVLKLSNGERKTNDGVRPSVTRTVRWWKRIGTLCLVLATTSASFGRDSLDAADGSYPTASIVQTTDGDLYGTAFGGGINDAGTVFRANPTGTVTAQYSFCSQAACTDGLTDLGTLGGN
jgi:uncharacterized repeat protein (TIGR03803 family)